MLIVMVVVAVVVAIVLLGPKGLQCASVICSIYNPVVGAMPGPEYNVAYNMHGTHIIAWYTPFVLSLCFHFILI